MAFRIKSAPIDRQLGCNVQGHADVENILTIGRASYISDFEMCLWEDKPNPLNILVGRFCSLSGNLKFILGGSHNYKNVTTFPIDSKKALENLCGDADIKPIPYNRLENFQTIIGHDVWIGNSATIMSGVKIGNGVVIGTNAVVAKDIPPYAIAVGNPARIVKYRFDEATIEKFLAVKWWNWDLKKIGDNVPLMDDVKKFLERHYSPALEEIFDDEVSRQIESFCAQGFKVYNFIADFRAYKPLWLRVVLGFCQSNFEDAVLVIWLDKNSAEKDFDSLALATNLIDSNAKKNILVVEPAAGESFSPCAIRKGTHFITTREMVTLEALDYLWDTNVKIVSALDDVIFDGEPLVDWKNLYRS